ncbi:ribonuclease Z [Methanogenium organophilum]|uniref:Ribonuclease Z n=1 Tax=Methanogenium organophilum TaxID=2199 RepID=A0A9X9S4H1_METOG|nr:ribonuclease Z [Methanogenium organophilum]WAI01516.1 ribonuclease Z [Methanogenium organophilum]
MAGETLHVYFLGTAGALPTPNRNPACIMMRRGADTLLFDCGEGAQQQMMRARTGFTVDAIFITHWHADHYLGVPGLIHTLSFMGRTEPLPIYGPRWVDGFVDGILALAKKPPGFHLEPRVLNPGDVVPFDGYHVRAFSAQHGIPGLGYILEEDARPGRFNREEAIRLGVPEGRLFGKLQRGEDVTVDIDGQETVVKADQVVGPSRSGRKVVYTGDTRPNVRSWLGWGMDADLLIHDATFDESEAERAPEVFHSTAAEAGMVAAQIDAARLALVHISSRYVNTATHIEDAGKHYSGQVFAPDDLEVFEIPYRSE